MSSVLLFLTATALAGPGHDHSEAPTGLDAGRAPPIPGVGTPAAAASAPVGAPGEPLLLVVRPLPAEVRPVLRASYTKAELIAAMGKTTTLAVHHLASVDHPDGPLLAAPATFACSVSGGVLVVTYVREGFVTDGLPVEGSCGEGERVFPFQIEVASSADATP